MTDWREYARDVLSHSKGEITDAEFLHRRGAGLDPVLAPVFENVWWAALGGAAEARDVKTVHRLLELLPLPSEQCTAMSGDDENSRCELEPGHGPYTRKYWRGGAGVNADWVEDPQVWDHAAPSQGHFWMEH